MTNFQNVVAGAMATALASRAPPAPTRSSAARATTRSTAAAARSLSTAARATMSSPITARKSRSTAARGNNTLELKSAVGIVDLADAADQAGFRVRRSSSTSRTSTGSALTKGVFADGLVRRERRSPAASGADTLDGGGGADVYRRQGAGDDTVYYHGTEVSIDGGTGNNTLI